jgi:hypothetical protein
MVLSDYGLGKNLEERTPCGRLKVQHRYIMDSLTVMWQRSNIQAEGRQRMGMGQITG